MDSRCQHLQVPKITNAELFAHWANELNRYITGRIPGCKTIVFADMLSSTFNGCEKYELQYGGYNELQYGGYNGATSLAVENNLLDADIILAIWHFGNEHLGRMNADIDFFTSKGYDFMTTSWYDQDNIEAWSELGLWKMADREKYKGHFNCSWSSSGNADESQWPVFADHFWNTGKVQTYFTGFEDDENGDLLPDGWNHTGDEPPSERLVNPSFEDDFDDGWTIVHPGEGIFNVDNGCFFEGANSAHFRSSNVTHRCTIRSDFVPVEGGAEYILSLWAKGTDIVEGAGDYDKLYLEGRFYDSDSDDGEIPGSVCGIHMDAEIISDWKEFKLPVIAPHNAEYFRINWMGLFRVNNGEGWIDAVSFKKKSSYSTDGADDQGSIANKYVDYPKCAVSVTGNSAVWYSDLIPVKPDAKYTVSLYCKRDKNGTETPNVKVVWYDIGGVFISEKSESLAGVTTDYAPFPNNAPFAKDFTAPVNAVYVKIVLEGEASGDEIFWFDTISLKKTKENDPIIFWKFNETSGNKVISYSGRKNHGTKRNEPSSVDGMLGKALDFDGTNDFVLTDRQPVGDYSSCTIAAWVYPTFNNKTQAIVSLMDSGNSRAIMRYGSGNKIQALYWNTGNECQTVTGTSTITLNEWQHWVFVLHDNNVKIYLNGVLDLDEEENKDRTLKTGTDSASCGRFEYFDGTIDDVYIYDYALTSEEIGKLFNHISNPSFEDGFDGWSITNTDLGTPATDTTYAWDGLQSVHFASDSTSSTTIHGPYVPVAPNTGYTLSLRAKGDSIVEGSSPWHKLYLDGRFYDSDKMFINRGWLSISMDTGTYDWKYFENTAKSPATAAYFRIHWVGIYSTGTGEGWIDDIRLSRSGN